MSAGDSNSSGIPFELKWGGKKIISSEQQQQGELCIVPGSSTDRFKDEICLRTGVPVARQKLLAKGGWKGTLGDRFPDGLSIPRGKKVLAVTLIGSAEALPEPPPVKPRFVEDMTPEELLANKQEEYTEAEGMIVPLQRPPPHRRDDHQKTEPYQYNRMVTGHPQQQIEDILLRRQKNQQEKEKEKEGEASQSSLCGEVVMTLGLELRRAYINALTVLADGTLLSGYDDGHIMAWRHGERVYDVVHDGGGGFGGGGVDNGVDCMLPLLPDLNNDASSSSSISFATGGRGCIRLWTEDGDCVQGFPCPPGTSPNSMVPINFATGHNNNNNTVIGMATSLKITRQSDPNQFRLVPQDEAGRQRRAQAEAQEAMIQQNLKQWSHSVTVYFRTTTTTTSGDAATTNNNNNNNSRWSSFVLKPDDNDPGAAPVTSLAVLSSTPSDDNNYNDNNGNNVVRLVCGDTAGGLRLWHIRSDGGDNSNGSSSSSILHREQAQAVQLCPPNTTTTTTTTTEEVAVVASVVCMIPLPNQMLAVSTTATIQQGSAAAATTARRRSLLSGGGANTIPVPTGTAVFIVDCGSSSSSNTTMTIPMALNGHMDTVQCMALLPHNGGLCTGGGKMDAKLKVWEEHLPWQQKDNKDNHKEKTVEAATTTTTTTTAAAAVTDDGSSSSIVVLSEATTELKEVGYVLAMTVLPDSKKDSPYFALAAARYNVVKICL